MILSLVDADNPILRTLAAPVETYDSQLRLLVDHMFDTMNYHNGMGLAAPQVGYSIQLFVFNYSDHKYVVTNPVIHSRSKNKLIMEEGCLSLPGVTKNVYRPVTISASYYNEREEKKLHVFTGMMARIFQHEFDHLQGKLIIDCP